MMRLIITAAGVAALSAAASPAFAQPATQELLALDTASLRSEIQQRYDRALARSTDPAVVGADDSRYNWANEAKVQCGIALGFLKSSTKDETSIANCALAASLMDREPTPMAPSQPVAPVMPAVPNEVCSQKLAGILFFDFDSAQLPADAQQTVSFVTTNAGPCGWTGFDVVGHADRAGSDAYNEGLSERRAQAVAAMMTSLGVGGSITTSARGETNPRVPTEDGVRNPQNRRVEITVR
ncbi:OmpA family protein [Altererythrobacter sp. TH136]|nr:OmpA family protein [Altererythrobacter sp. TH136]